MVEALRSHANVCVTCNDINTTDGCNVNKYSVTILTATVASRSLTADTCGLKVQSSHQQRLGGCNRFGRHIDCCTDRYDWRIQGRCCIILITYCS